MDLTPKQTQFIKKIDEQAKRILSEGGSDEELLVSLHDVMGDLKEIISSRTHSEMDLLCRQYDGFYCYMKVLEQLASNIASGKIKAPDILPKHPLKQNSTSPEPNEQERISKAQGITQELNKVMTDALFQLKSLVDADAAQQKDFMAIVKTFLLGMITTTVDMVELSVPGSAPLLYADVEAGAKLGGLRAIEKWSSDYGSSHYSVSNIAPDDMVTGMNYLGQQLSTAIIKGLHELPMPLRNQEMMLRSVEVLLANLLSQKFGDDAPRILDSLCEHVHMALTDLGSRVKH